VLASFLPWFAPDPQRPIATCFGGGGAFGIGFDMGVADALKDSGIHVDRGPMLGTSAGSWTAAALATGMTCEEIFDFWDTHRDVETPVRVIEHTRQLFGDKADPRVRGMVVHVASGRRLALSGRDHSLADIVAASSSPPRQAVPHRIGRRRYIDGGVRSVTSADRARPARLLVVVTPIAGQVLGPFGRMCERVTRYEMLQWRQRTGGRVLFVRPNREIASLVSFGESGGMLDLDVGRRTYQPAYELGLRCAERFQSRHPELAEDVRLAA
jgi:predicted acylesterase/phospholipase RssA